MVNYFIINPHYFFWLLIEIFVFCPKSLHHQLKFLCLPTVTHLPCFIVHPLLFDGGQSAHLNHWTKWLERQMMAFGSAFPLQIWSLSRARGQAWNVGLDGEWCKMRERGLKKGKQLYICIIVRLSLFPTVKVSWQSQEADKTCQPFWNKNLLHSVTHIIAYIYMFVRISNLYERVYYLMLICGPILYIYIYFFFFTKKDDRWKFNKENTDAQKNNEQKKTDSWYKKNLIWQLIYCKLN